MPSAVDSLWRKDESRAAISYGGSIDLRAAGRLHPSASPCHPAGLPLPLAAWVAHVAPCQPSSVGTAGWRVQLSSLPAQLLPGASFICQMDVNFSANPPGSATWVSQHQPPADIPHV